MATISDIAKKANVSKSTVSLVINNTGYVSDKTRIKVEEAIAELNYIPNGLARNLSLRKSSMVGIMVPDIANPFFAEFIKCGENELYRHGYKTMICNTMQNSNREQEFLDMLKSRFMDGIIIGKYTLPPERYLELNRPMVCLDRRVGGNVPIIRSAHEKSGEWVAKLLLDGHCRRIGLFTGTDTGDTPSNRRQDILTDILRSNGCRVIPVTTDTPYALGDVVQELFNKYDIDGAVGADLYVMACLQEAYRRGKRIPEDFQTVAFDGTYLVDANMVPITAIRQPIEKLASCAVQVLLDMINGRAVKKKEYVLDISVFHGSTTLYTKK